MFLQKSSQYQAAQPLSNTARATFEVLCSQFLTAVQIAFSLYLRSFVTVDVRYTDDTDALASKALT